MYSSCMYNAFALGAWLVSLHFLMISVAVPIPLHFNVSDFIIQRHPIQIVNIIMSSNSEDNTIT